MRQVFDEPELDEIEPREETEITLGTAGLLVVFVAILAVCGICFGLGYAAGHRGNAAPAAVAAVQPLQQNPDVPLAATPGKLKPQAAPQTVAASTSADSTVADLGPSNDPDADVVGAAGAAPAQTPVSQPALSPSSNPQWTVKQALPQQPVQPAPAPPAYAVSPSEGGAQRIMVQIAAVSHSEDAQVLMNALRRRGYPVSSRHDVSDNLIHVQVGPFFNRNDANAMRMKLLNDGYNAVIEP